MTPPAHDPATLAWYQGEAVAYAARGNDDASRLLADFTAWLPAGGRVLELGCGGGRDAAAMEAMGFEVDATDGTPAFVELASARLIRPARLMRFDELDADAAYDGVWANASLLHVPWPALPTIVAAIHRALRPGGWHAASFKLGHGGGRDARGRYYNYPTSEALIGAYRDAADWSELTWQEDEAIGWDNELTPWIMLIARHRPAPASTNSAAISLVSKEADSPPPAR